MKVFLISSFLNAKVPTRSTLCIATVALFQVHCSAPEIEVDLPPVTTRPEARSPRHVVIILADTLRPDYVSAYGSDKVQTPNIDALASEGIVFEKAFTTAPISAPAYASLFTSAYPFQHGLTNNGQRLAEGQPLLQVLMRERGFYTAAFVANYSCGKRFGFGRGFEEFYGPEIVGRTAFQMSETLLPWLEKWEPAERRLFLFLSYMDPHEPYTIPQTPHWLRVRFGDHVLAEGLRPEIDRELDIELTVPPGRHPFVLERVKPPLSREFIPRHEIRWLLDKGILQGPVSFSIDEGIEKAKKSKGRASVIASEFPVTGYFTNPTESPISGTFHLRWRRKVAGLKEALTMYPLCVKHMDDEIGRVLAVFKEKGVLEDTLIIFLSDHGEGLGNHGLTGHIHQLYDSLLHVPLIIRAPHFEGGRRASDLVSIVDVAPTILELCAPDADWQGGKSLIPYMAGQPTPARDGIFGETSPPEARERITALRTRKAKLIVNHTTMAVEFYDLDEDPKERIDIANEENASEELAIVSSLYLKSLGLQDLFDDIEAERLLIESLDTDEREELEALGYLE